MLLATVEDFYYGGIVPYEENTSESWEPSTKVRALGHIMVVQVIVDLRISYRAGLRHG